ncbi:uncharacterized protein A4U43_C02F9090 [Asparagus officinalis]|uniref:Uncharacterized protein n=1 Tax=Asparagus officinalis TaxID=4686 RepID=A0A5P1FH70_ASPOF|nr:uncharacterized protein A4U43_C02F9090 [Asparagus officinalis]
MDNDDNGCRETGESSDRSRYSRPSSGGGASSAGSKHVVVVMDALREFSTKPLEWALEHVVEPGYTLTLLGVMPWLSLPLLCKTWLDIWTLDPGDLSNIQDKSEWKNDPKHQRLRTMVDLCDARGISKEEKILLQKENPLQYGDDEGRWNG